MSHATRGRDPLAHSHHIDAIDEAIAQLRGLFGLIGSLCEHAKEPVDVWRQDVSAFVWLLGSKLDEIDHGAQALFARADRAGKGVR
jgi:hypothetical protein